MVGEVKKMRSTRDHKCQGDDCKQKAWHWITTGTTNKHVCNDCRDKYLEQKWKVLAWR